MKISSINISTAENNKLTESLAIFFFLVTGSFIAWLLIHLPYILTFSIIVSTTFLFITLINIKNGIHLFIFIIPMHLIALNHITATLSEFDSFIFSALKDVFLGILGACFMIAILMGRVSFPKNNITFFVLIFLFVNVLITILSPTIISFWGLRQQLEFAFFYFLTNGLIKNQRDIKNSIVAFIGSSLIVAFYAFYILIGSRVGYGYEYGYLPEHIVGRLTVFGGTETSGVFSTYISTCLLILIGFLFFYKRFKYPVIYILGGMTVLLYYLEIIFSFSRRAWLAVVISVLFISLLGQKIKCFIFLTASIAIILFTTCYHFSPKAVGILSDRLQSILDTHNVYNTPRLSEWRLLLIRSKENLFLGEGLGKVGSVSTKFGIKNATNTHNFYLSKLVQTGILGLSLFMLISFATLRLMIKSFCQSHTSFFRAVSAGLIMAFISLMIQSFFSLGIETYPFNIYYWFFVALTVNVFNIINNKKDVLT